MIDIRSDGAIFVRRRLSGQLMTSSGVVVQYLPWSEGTVFGRSRLSGLLMTSSGAVVQYLPRSEGTVFGRSRLSGQLMTSSGAVVQYLPQSEGTIFGRSRISGSEYLGKTNSKKRIRASPSSLNKGLARPCFGAFLDQSTLFGCTGMLLRLSRGFSLGRWLCLCSYYVIKTSGNSLFRSGHQQLTNSQSLVPTLWQYVNTRLGDMMRHGLIRMLWGRQSLLTPNIPKANLLYVRTVHWNSWGDEGHIRSRGGKEQPVRSSWSRQKARSSQSGVASPLRRQGAALSPSEL
ncbi:hypothetical protein Tco_0855400, partial [Tanacetum coccineum]